MKIGVFLCECGGNISEKVQLTKVRDQIAKMPNVKAVHIAKFLCTSDELQLMVKHVKGLALERVVVAACSPHMHEIAFRDNLTRAGLNPYLMQYVNIREQCSWVHNRSDEATEKAVDLVRAGIRRATVLQPLQPQSRTIKKHVLVVGGGIAGITSAIQVAGSGYEVTLIERGPSIGGHMAQLSKTFPTLDCAPCILSPKMSDVAKQSNIHLLTNTQIKHVAGGPGSFHVDLLRKPRGVDAEKCISCGACARACPISAPNEFDEGLSSRKAIYRPFPESVPASYVVDFENCTKCGRCVEACPADAIDLDQSERTSEIDVGAIILASGFDLAKSDSLKNYWLDHPDVVTGLQMERIMINKLAVGEVLKRANGERVKEIAYVLCAGSRDPHHGVPYCSKVCCPYAIKQAILLKKSLPYIRPWIYYTDIRMTGRGFEEFYELSRRISINFIHGKPGDITLDSSGKLQLIAEDKDSGYLIRNRVDMVVLCNALKPSEGTAELGEKLRIPLGDDGFIAEKHPKLSPVLTRRAGIFAAGAALGPKDIRDSVADAQAAAAQAVELVGKDEIFLDPVKPAVDLSLCSGCGSCAETCPSKAIAVNDGRPVFDIASCTGCGACVPACPEAALELAHYTRRQLGEEIQGLFCEESKEVRIVGFFGDEIAYTAADAAGTARLSYEANLRIVRLPSTALIGPREILHTLASGADAVLLCETDESSEARISQQRIEETRRLFSKYDLNPRRLEFMPILLPIFRLLPQKIDLYTGTVRSLGKISVDTRTRIASELTSPYLAKGT